MIRVLLVGYEPETVDFSNPALPTGLTAEKIRAGLAVGMNQFAERGWEGDVVLIRAAPTAAIAFNTRPEDTADAAARRLAAGSGAL